MIESRIDWLKERQKGIGGSDVAVIWGLISVVAGWALMTGLFHAMAFYATH